MVAEDIIEKTLLEQILEDMLINIQKRKEFDDVTISGLKQLVEQNKLKKTSEVISVIQSK